MKLSPHSLPLSLSLPSLALALRYLIGHGGGAVESGGRETWATDYMLGSNRFGGAGADGDDGDDATSRGFPRAERLEQLPLGPRYLAAVYWAVMTMSSVGYGDVLPKTDGERLFAFFAMVIGGAGYGFIIGSLASVVSDVDAHTRVYNERMETILAYMSQRGFPRPLQRKVRAERAPRHRGGRSQSGRRG